MWWKTIVSSVISFFASGAMIKVKKCIPIIVAEVEKAMQDGKIDAVERKALAMKVIDTLITQFGMSVNPIIRWVISIMVDNIAKKLPAKDIKIPDLVIQVSKKF